MTTETQLQEQQLEQVEMTIEQAKKQIRVRGVLESLRRNKDFREIIEEGYFEKEAVRCVLLRADPNMEDAESRTIIDNQITAIGYLRRYFAKIQWQGNQAEQALADHEQAREEILAGDDLEPGNED